MERLKMAVDDLLIKLAKTFTRPKLQTVFLINNYDMIIAVLKVWFLSFLLCRTKENVKFPYFMFFKMVGGHQALLIYSIIQFHMAELTQKLYNY